MPKDVCGFCGKPSSKERKIILSQLTGARICDECIINKLDELGKTKDLPELVQRRFQKMAFELRKLIFPLKR